MGRHRRGLPACERLQHGFRHRDARDPSLGPGEGRRTRTDRAYETAQGPLERRLPAGPSEACPDERR